MVSHSALAVDFYCYFKLANDATDGISPINLIRVDLETKTGTQYSTIREEADYKIIAVKEHPLKEMSYGYLRCFLKSLFWRGSVDKSVYAAFENRRAAANQRM